MLYGCHMVSLIRGGTQTKCIWKQDSEANIWVRKGCECVVKKAPEGGIS